MEEELRQPQGFMKTPTVSESTVYYNYPKYWGTLNSIIIILKFKLGDVTFLQKRSHQNGNSAYPDQTAPKEQSDQGIHCSVEYFCPDM